MMSGIMPAAKAMTSPAQIGHVRAQAEELEGIFLNTLMKEMFASLGTDSNAMGGGFAEETWRDMQAEQMADAVSKAGGIGLADAIMGDLLRIQERAQVYNSTSKDMRQ
jgi:flagellar protein FlgJ